MSRLRNTDVLLNKSESYQNLFNRKKINFIKQYGTFEFGELKNFRDYNLDMTIHTIKPFEKLYNLSNIYYNSPDYGWIILYTNGMASELELKIGDLIMIYYPLDTLLGLL